MSETCEPEDANDETANEAAGEEEEDEEEPEVPPQRQASLDALLHGVSDMLLAKLDEATAASAALQPLHPDVVIEIADALFSRITDNNWDMHLGGGWMSVPEQDLEDSRLSLTLELNALVKSGAFAVQMCESMDALFGTSDQVQLWWDGSNRTFSEKDAAYVADAQAFRLACVPSRETVRTDLENYLVQRTQQFGKERLVWLLADESDGLSEEEGSGRSDESGDGEESGEESEESGEESAEGEESESVGESDGSTEEDEEEEEEEEGEGDEGDEGDESDEEGDAGGVKRELEQDEELSAEEVEALRSKARRLDD